MLRAPSHKARVFRRGVLFMVGCRTAACVTHFLDVVRGTEVDIGVVFGPWYGLLFTVTFDFGGFESEGAKWMIRGVNRPIEGWFLSGLGVGART